MWSLTFFVKSNCRSLCCISIPICFDMICERPLKVEDAPMPSLPNQDHSWHGQGLIREGRNPKIAAHMAIECSIFGLKFHSNFQFDASRLLWSRIMKHPVESLHYSWVSTTTIVDTLWARLWCIHNPKILSWIGIGIGKVYEQLSQRSCHSVSQFSKNYAVNFNMNFNLNFNLNFFILQEYKI